MSCDRKPAHVRHEKLVALVGAVILTASLAGCQTAQAGENAGSATSTSSYTQSTVPPATVTTVPADGATGVRPDAPVTVSVEDGTVVDVDVVAVADDPGLASEPADHAQPVNGQAAVGRATWATTAALHAGTTYSVTTTIVDGAGRETTTTSSFTTLTAERTLDASILPRDGWTVGVGMPVIVSFDTAVEDKAAVESRLSVATTPQLEGAWRWESDKQVQWRPRDFWPSGTTATVTAALAGVEAAPGTWGEADQSATFTVGSAMVSTVDIAAHTMTVTRDGEVLRTIPVTTGKHGYETRNGTKVIISRESEHRMDAATLGTDKDDPEYYDVLVEYAMRLTWSGEFIHAAPWSVGRQGEANVSHGCTGLSTADAQWLFGKSKVGDVVNFVGGQRALEWGNGYTAWEMPFEQWAEGSAL